jgi:hypothetical protein
LFVGEFPISDSIIIAVQEAWHGILLNDGCGSRRGGARGAMRVDPTNQLFPLRFLICRFNYHLCFGRRAWDLRGQAPAEVSLIRARRGA